MVPEDDAECGMILVMGVTGSGKSYFINKLAQGSVTEGAGLRSETETCQIVRVGVGRHEVAVVDTPGFDDTTRSDAEILEEVTEFLCTQYELGIPLKGIIYMHRITDNKMSGSAQRYFEMFNCLCGERNFGNVVLLTTMWSELKEEGKGLERERELRRDFWNAMSAKGSTIRRFDGSSSMAGAFICRLMRKENIVLDIQNELVEQGKRLEETKAGKVLVPQLERQIGEAGERLESLAKIIDEADDSEKLEIRRLKRQRGSIEEQRQAKLHQRQKLQKRLGRNVAEKVEGEKKEGNWKSKLTLFGSDMITKN
ncbi:uncharacterized protein K460DRAFT_412159 [Cucurbitaria berberidis CBS 394.84]|uniref:AIG1-type G domain-containing protein n=1 Tax=Cucurbitaria berberidis CBS 394.84 TaxID=1168544 RepID=A0A9P4GS50_9PLEO|nr:uncharacterized protein K460DRAFT_412159 [Cucurbitaria berberidis CBS 394.84]KAF1850456.1 hypothetical protein K460DRAFT_412159 [Cucurbitaria berberidis CBS 394.84]